MKVIKIMKKHIQLIILFALTSSLPLTCMFNTVKKIGKTVCVFPLTYLTVDYVGIDSLEKECVAKHEAGHAIAALQKKRALVSVCIEKGSMNTYTGLTHSRINQSDANIDAGIHAIACTFAGPAQDLENKSLFERRNVMELELGLPLTRIQRQLSDDLEYIHGQQCHEGDLKNAYSIAYAIAETEIKNNKNNNYQSNSNIKKQIDDRVQVLLLQGLQEAETLVKQNKLQIDAVAQELYDKEFLSGDEVNAIIRISAINS